VTFVGKEEEVPYFSELLELTQQTNPCANSAHIFWSGHGLLKFLPRLAHSYMGELYCFPHFFKTGYLEYF